MIAALASGGFVLAAPIGHSGAEPLLLLVPHLLLCGYALRSGVFAASMTTLVLAAATAATVSATKPFARRSPPTAASPGCAALCARWLPRRCC